MIGCGEHYTRKGEASHTLSKEISDRRQNINAKVDMARGVKALKEMPFHKRMNANSLKKSAQRISKIPHKHEM